VQSVKRQLVGRMSSGGDRKLKKKCRDFRRPEKIYKFSLLTNYTSFFFDCSSYRSPNTEGEFSLLAAFRWVAF
jgi:hypothetical protein